MIIFDLASKSSTSRNFWTILLYSLIYLRTLVNFCFHSWRFTNLCFALRNWCKRFEKYTKTFWNDTLDNDVDLAKSLKLSMLLQSEKSVLIQPRTILGKILKRRLTIYSKVFVCDSWQHLGEHPPWASASVERRVYPSLRQLRKRQTFSFRTFRTCFHWVTYAS